jgi:phospholipid/cholesterol/gamma-HCH transport system ATP-binding protein
MSQDEVAAVRFDRVSKSLREEHILDDVSFSSPRGTALSILGRRGAGKTIALKLSIGLGKPDQGRVLINGEDVNTLDTPDLLRVRRSTGFVFQNSAVFDSVTVAENIALPLRYNSGMPKGEIDRKVHQHLLQVGLERDGSKMPDKLSVGMRKLLGFARALACDPAILLLDDPWNGVDSTTAASIRKLLLDLKQNRQTTLLIIANRISAVRSISDQIAVLDGGRLLACGPITEVEHCENSLVKQFISQEDF